MKIKELIVVEGKTDICFLSSFLDADFYSVNGSAVSNKDIEFLKQINKKRGLIILTDPDYPGLKIRNYINSKIADCKNAYVNKENCIKNGKVGVAESTIEEINKSLENLITFTNQKNTITKIELYELNLVGKSESKDLRIQLCNKLKIGFSNSNSLLKKLNALGYTKSDIEEVLYASKR